MKKKFTLSILTACLLTTSVLAACGGKGEKSSSVPSGDTSSSQNVLSSSSLTPTSVSSQSTGIPLDSSSSLPAPSSSSSQAPTPSSSSQAPTPSSSSAAPSSSSNPASSSSQAPAEFDFTVSLRDNPTNTLFKGEQAEIVINAAGGDQSIEREYKFTSGTKRVATVDANGIINAREAGSSNITIKESKSNKTKYLRVTVIVGEYANGGYNFASSTGPEAIAKRTEILGSLEKYAMDHHLTGITLFENGGYVKYSERVNLPTENYVTGYGFGLLSEGTLANDSISHENNPAHKMYLHSGTSQDPRTINSRNNTGSQVSDLEGYISSSFWGTKLNSTRTQYEWYPVLAKDTVTYDGTTTPFTRPIPVFNGQEVKPGQVDPNPTGLYDTWRIYLKTGNSVKYRYNGASWGTEFDGRQVVKEDYEFAYRLLLTGSHNLKRGAEMAGDQTYGIVGAHKYFLNTKEASDEGALAIWNAYKESGDLGIKVGTDVTNGDFIQLRILNPIDRFTAMYTFSSNLLTPMPEEFISTIGSGSVKVGATRYGDFNNNTTAPSGHRDAIVDYVLSVGPYMLEAWDKEQAIVFKKNDQWTNDPGRYNIAGVKILIIDSSQSSTKIYERFNLGDLDSTGIPQKYLDVEVGKPRVYETKGDSTFKLNVNSCDQETWTDLFGPQGKIAKNSKWTVKPWMSNDNFLKGLFYSINRKEFAANRGVKPSINYFSDAYLTDPENGISYNDSQAHKDAVAAYEVYDSDGNSTFGYSYDKAVSCFRQAVTELLNDHPDKISYGTVDNPFEIEINISWMYPTDQDDYGNAIAKYFTDAFNDTRVCDGLIKLVVDQPRPSDDWMDVYEHKMMIGQFDLGFGAISGNTYNPINFLEVLKSDNSSTFTLNWGPDTSKVSSKNPLIYDDKLWSFDGLWSVANYGGILHDGENAKIAERCYLEPPSKDEVYEGCSFKAVTQFINSEDVAINVTRVQIFVANSSSYSLPFTIEKDGNLTKASVTLSADLAAEIDTEIRRANKLDDPNNQTTFKEHALTLELYDKLWWVEVTYTLSVKLVGSTEFSAPTESYVNAFKNEDAIIER